MDNFTYTRHPLSTVSNYPSPKQQFIIITWEENFWLRRTKALYTELHSTVFLLYTYFVKNTHTF